MARTSNLTDFLTDVATAIREKKGTTDTILASNFDTEIASIETGGGSTEPIFTGHYDAEGLRTIGWSDEEIEYYQQNGVQWNESEDNYFKLNETELAGDDSSNTRFLPKNSTKKNFNGYYRLLAIPLLNTSNVTNMSRMFSGCYSLTTIPQLDTSSVTNMSNMFSSCYSLTTIPQLVTSSVTNMSNMFSSCYSLAIIPQLDTSNVTTMNNMFSGCYSLKAIPQLDTSNVTSMNSMFQNCSLLTTIPQLETSKVTNMGYMFYRCFSLTTIPQLETSNVTTIGYMLSDCTSLTDFGGLKNLGQAYDTSKSANYSSYKLDLSKSTKLTEQSLINVLTNLYDIKTKGCKAQQVVLGSDNLAKLVSEEGQQALSNAQAKGWTIS